MARRIAWPSRRALQRITRRVRVVSHRASAPVPAMIDRVVLVVLPVVVPIVVVLPIGLMPIAVVMMAVRAVMAVIPVVIRVVMPVGHVAVRSLRVPVAITEHQVRSIVVVDGISVLVIPVHVALVSDGAVATRREQRDEQKFDRENHGGLL